jgi:hypothetical protein
VNAWIGITVLLCAALCAGCESDGRSARRDAGSPESLKVGAGGPASVPGRARLPASVVGQRVLVTWGAACADVAPDQTFQLTRRRRWRKARAVVGEDTVLCALVSPRDARVALTSGSTAVALVVEAIARDEPDLDLGLLRSVAEVEPAVSELAALLDMALSLDKGALSRRDEVPGFRHKLVNAELACRARLSLSLH